MMGDTINGLLYKNVTPVNTEGNKQEESTNNSNHRPTL